MIQITIYKNHKNEYVGFDSMGHAEYAESGKDIVCAGVSALVINAVNSISSFTTDKADVDMIEETGRISLRFSEAPSHDAGLLMESLVLGLQGIQNFYGNEYISLICKEV